MGDEHYHRGGLNLGGLFQPAYAVDSAQVVEAGDLVYMEADDVRPASYMTWDTSLAVMQAKFRRLFAGLALAPSVSGATAPIRVAQVAVAEMPVAVNTFEIGDWLGVNDNADGDGLADQELIKVTSPELAIAKVLKRYSVATTKVECLLLGAQSPFGLRQRVSEIVFHADATIYAAGGDIVTNYTFGRPVKIINAIGIVTTATTGDGVFTLKNGSNSLDDTLTIPGSSAVGTVVNQAIADANGYDYLEGDDQFDIAGDGTPSAGAVDVLVRFIEL